MEVSAKNGLGIKEMFSRMTQEIYKFQQLEFDIDEAAKKAFGKKAGTSVTSQQNQARTFSDGHNSLQLDPVKHS